MIYTDPTETRPRPVPMTESVLLQVDSQIDLLKARRQIEARLKTVEFALKIRNGSNWRSSE